MKLTRIKYALHEQQENTTNPSPLVKLDLCAPCDDESVKRLDRIVACVNVCEEIPNPLQIIGFIKNIKRLQDHMGSSEVGAYLEKTFKILMSK